MHISDKTYKELKGRYGVESGPLVDGMKTYFIADQGQDRVRADIYIYVSVCNVYLDCIVTYYFTSS